MILQKYNYAQIPRKSVDGERRYLTPDGNAVASVTTILSATKDTAHLEQWRARVGEAAAAQITQEAAGVGTRMHKFLETYVETDVFPEPGSNPFSIKAHAMAQVIIENALVDVGEIWGSEVALYIPQLYAGTTDLVGTYKGNPCILDFKQSNKPKKSEWVNDYRLQLVAYGLAHNELYGTDISEGHVFMCTRGNDSCELGGEQYLQFDVWPDEWEYWKNQWYDRVYRFYESRR